MPQTPTPTANGTASETILVNASGTGGSELVAVQVEQGPRWLAALVVDPPAWLTLGLSLVALVAISLAALAIKRNGGIPLEAVYSQLFFTSVTVATLGLMAVIQPLPAPYLVDVLVAALAGTIVARLAADATWPHLRPRLEASEVVVA
jgi:hypothetical protein